MKRILDGKNRLSNAAKFACCAFALLLAPVASAMTAGVATTAPEPEHDAASEQPNVLIIMIDDMNDWVGIMGGHPQVKTPHIDALAARSAAFTNAHAPAPLCSPSRTALLTGMRPSTSGIYNNHADWRKVAEERGIVTLPGLLRANGYETLGAGKIFHAHTFDANGYVGYNSPSDWSYYYPSLQQVMPFEATPPAVPVNGNPITEDFDWGVVSDEDGEMADTQVVDWVIEKMSEPAAGPRAFFAGIYRPHLPWYVPQEYFDLYPLEDIVLPEVVENDLADVPDTATLPFLEMSEHPPMKLHDWTVGEDQWREGVQAYLASISYADAQVGRLISALEQSDQLDNTVVVLLSDHGFHLGEKGRWRKQTLWSEATKVLLTIKPHGSDAVPVHREEPVSLMDIYPTLASLLGLDAPGYLEGNSLLPLMLNEKEAWPYSALTTNGFRNHSIVTERFRYTRYANGAEELYDLKDDPNEWRNLAGQDAFNAVIDELRAELPKTNARPLRH